MSFRTLSMTWTSCALVLSAIWAGGCLVGTDTEEGNGPSFKYPKASDFCQALAEAECNDEVVKSCYGSSAELLEDDRAKCVTARAGTCTPTGPSYNPAFAEDCIKKRGEVMEDGELTRDEIKAADEACLAVFAAGGESGTSCSADANCDAGEGLRCIVKPGQTTGSCGTPEIIGGGSKCDAATAVCDAGFYCATDKDNYCLEQPAEGGACSAAAPCKEGFRCSAAGVCEAKAGNGAACTAELIDEVECLGGFCIRGSSGDAEGICSAVYRLELTSATCDDYR